MILPPPREHNGLSDDAQHRGDRNEGAIARSSSDVASQMFEAARSGVRTVARWLEAEAVGSGPVRSWLSNITEGYRKSQSQLIEVLPPGLEAALARNIGSTEVILIKLKGGLKEALICTDQKAYIIKMGFMTGNTFGDNVYQLPLANIGSIDVRFGGASWQGRFELVAHGTPSSVRHHNDATRAINCVTLYGPLQAQRFRKASSFILERRPQAMSPVVSAGRHASPSDGETVALLVRLADLYKKGLLTREEFEQRKQTLLTRD